MALTPHQIHDLRKTIKLKFYELNGLAFENFFSEVMSMHNPNFKQIKPQGSIGDRKNDGYDPLKGIYYQVYSPEKPESKQNQAVEKLRKDLDGLISYWREQHGFEIKEFYFVFNDKYAGSYPTTETTLEELKRVYLLEKCEVLMAKDLTNIIFELSEVDRLELLGWFPQEEIVYQLEHEYLDEIFSFLQTKGSYVSFFKNGNIPDFSHKLDFNHLVDEARHHLITGSFAYGDMEDYFKKNDKYLRKLVQLDLNQRYLDLKNKIPKELSKENASYWVLKALVDSYCPAGKPPEQIRNFHQHIVPIIAYFFESCDVFEEPPIKRLNK